MKTPTTWSHPRHPLIEARMDDLRGAPYTALAGRRNCTTTIRSLFVQTISIAGLAAFLDTPALYVEAALRFELDASAKRAWRKWYREVRG